MALNYGPQYNNPYQLPPLTPGSLAFQPVPAVPLPTPSVPVPAVAPQQASNVSPLSTSIAGFTPANTPGLDFSGNTGQAADANMFTQGPLVEGRTALEALQASGMGGDVLGSAMADAMGGQGGIGGIFKNTFMTEGGGLNIGNITDILGSIGSIYGAIKSFGLAKDSLDFSKKAFETNLANQTKSYNTALTDRATARAAQYGRGSGYVNDYVEKNKL